VYCSVLHCVAVCCGVSDWQVETLESRLAVCCSVLQCVAVCCSVLQCVTSCSVLQCVAVCCCVMHCVRLAGRNSGESAGAFIRVT